MLVQLFNSLITSIIVNRRRLPLFIPLSFISRLLYSDDDADSDDDSKVAMATLWGLRLHRRGSSTGTTTPIASNRSSPATDREKIALDINLLKQQYGKLRQRQKQAQIILTNYSRQTTSAAFASASATTGQVSLNNLLAGRSAITSSKGRRPGPPPGAIPPARISTSGGGTSGGKSVSKQKQPPKLTKQPSLPAERTETLHWKDTEVAEKMRRNSLKWKDIKLVSEQEEVDKEDELVGDESKSAEKTKTNRRSFSTRNRSESSSYSEDSDSSSDTSLCDDLVGRGEPGLKDSGGSSVEGSPFKKQAEVEDKVPENVLLDEIKKGVDELLEREDDLAITSTSQLSPVTQYLNVSSISPLRTPSSPFDLSEILTNLSPSPENEGGGGEENASGGFTSEVGDDLLEVTEEGVTNSYFERVVSLETRPSLLELARSGEHDDDDGEVTLGRDNSLLSIPTYEILDVDELDAGGNEGLNFGRSTSMGVMGNAEEQTVMDSGTRLKEGGIVKGKSASLDDTNNRPVLKKCLPMSSSDPVEGRRSEKALEIIQENSKILHRILNKNQRSSAGNEEEERLEGIGKGNKIGNSSVSLGEGDKEMGAKEGLPTSHKTQSISDTLSSIENTIQSINSLCQERETFVGGKMTRGRLMENIEKIISSGNRIEVHVEKVSEEVGGGLSKSRSPSLSPIREEERKREITREEDPWQRTAHEEYLLRNLEYRNTLDKSPSSPVITRNYLESLKPEMGDGYRRRSVKSAENSPSRSFGVEVVVERELDTKELLEKYLRRGEREDVERKRFILGSSNSPLESPEGKGNKEGLMFDYGIEARKHRSLEFDAM